MKKFLQLMAGNSWISEAAAKYGIPTQNLLEAYAMDGDIRKSFDGSERWLVSSGSNYFDTGLKVTSYPFAIKSKYNFSTVGSQKAFFGNFGSGNVGSLIGSTSQSKHFFWSGKEWLLESVSANSDYEIEISYDGTSGRTAIINGTEYTSTLTNVVTSSATTIGIFSAMGSHTYNVPASGSKLAYADILVNGTHHFYIPFLNGTTVTMIDLMTMDILDPQGTGTLTIE